MSKVFYDHLINFEKLEKIVKKSATSSDEKEELWKIVDEIIHHKVMGCILDNLDSKHHEEFVGKFAQAPFDDKLMFYVSERGNKNIENEIKETVKKIENEILQELKVKKN